MSVKSHPLTCLLGLVLGLGLFASACGSGSGAPSSAGNYPVQRGTVHFDGDRYQLYWADSGGGLHPMNTHNLRLVQDPQSTFLEVPQGGGDPILHLQPDEPITVQGRDHEGAFGSPWFPFLLGATLGGGFGGGRGGQTVIINNPAPGESRGYAPSTPTYRYPPTGTFGRDDELHGSLDSSKPTAPDYSKVQPAPYATSGKSSGTGGGSAASNKSAGTASVGAGSRGALPGSSTNPSPRVGGGGGSGSSGSKGIGGARAPAIGKH